MIIMVANAFSGSRSVTVRYSSLLCLVWHRDRDKHKFCMEKWEHCQEHICKNSFKNLMVKMSYFRTLSDYLGLLRESNNSDGLFCNLAT